jgi:hypothetical protein
MHPVHTFPPYSPKICSNIIFPSTPRSSEWSLSLCEIQIALRSIKYFDTVIS